LVKQKNINTKLMLDIDSYSLSNDEINLLGNPFVAGVILFSRNIKSQSQIQALCNQIKSINPDLLIAVDQEGGRVQRLEIGCTKLPSMHQLSEYCSINNFSNIDFARDLGWLMASEVLASGIDLSFAPVLDLDLSRSSVIGDRSFGDDPHQVIKIASLFIDGMNEAGMVAVGKHFPGHGGIFSDSHYEYVEDLRSLNDLEKHDLLPFKALKNKLGGIMTAHVSFPKVDKHIATFSRFWLTNILREKIDFQGIIFSDDLSMKGTDSAGSVLQKVKQAIDAGCNILLICNDRLATLEALNYMKANYIESKENLLTFETSHSISWNSLQHNDRRIRAEIIANNILKNNL
jgi:beta-N-acetylhexosaminidase